MSNRAPETQDQRRARAFANLRRLGDLAMELAETAHTQAKRQFATPSRTPVAYDYAAAFATLSRAVRQAVTIEIRLDAPPRTRTGFRLATRAHDPRSPILHRLFRDAVAKHPQHAARGREIVAYIDQHLEADPDQQEPIDDTIAHLCEAFGVVIDISRVPDELLDLIHPEPPDSATDPPPDDMNA